MRKLIIAGGGLVGCMAAILLEQNGYEVEVYEKRDSADLAKGGGRSINLVVTSRGIHALEMAGLWQSVKKMCVPVYGRMMHDLNGKLHYQAYGTEQSNCNYSISRSELNLFLQKQIKNIHFAESLLEINTQHKKARFEKSGWIPYEILIGADGANSVLREELKSQGKNFHTDFLSSDYKELFIPLAKNGQPQLDTSALHIWARGTHMMMALPNLDGSFTVTLYMPKNISAIRQSYSHLSLNEQENIPHFEKIKTTSDLHQLFVQNFPDAISLIPELEKLYFQNPQGILGTVRGNSWFGNGDVMLIGDAAHAIVPFFGQGMNLGFEDCSYLISALQDTKGNWTEAMKLYDERQRPNANAIADMALENFVEMSQKMADEKFLLRKKVESELEKKFKGSYRSRYSFITYTLEPYARAKFLGEIQNQILDELCANINLPEQVDWQLANQLIETKWMPVLERSIKS